MHTYGIKFAWSLFLQMCFSHKKTTVSDHHVLVFHACKGAEQGFKLQFQRVILGMFRPSLLRFGSQPKDIPTSCCRQGALFNLFFANHPWDKMLTISVNKVGGTGPVISMLLSCYIWGVQVRSYPFIIRPFLQGSSL